MGSPVIVDLVLKPAPDGSPASRAFRSYPAPTEGTEAASCASSPAVLPRFPSFVTFPPHEVRKWQA